MLVQNSTRKVAISESYFTFSQNLAIFSKVNSSVVTGNVVKFIKSNLIVFKM